MPTRYNPVPPHLRCGAPLKTRPCGRSAWWPGGRCPKHGYGASTLEEWVRGVARKEVGPDRILFSVHFCTLIDDEPTPVRWAVSEWPVRRCFGQGRITPEDLAVTIDRLASEGLAVEYLIAQANHAITSAMREQIRRSGDADRAREVAADLRRFGYGAMASDDYVFLALADAERLRDVLGAGDPTRSSGLLARFDTRADDPGEIG